MTNSPITVRTVEFLLDKVASRLRWVFFPFWLMSRCTDGLMQIFWLVVNEHVKSQLGACGRGVRIHGKFKVTNPKGLHIGNNVHINTNAFIRAEGGVSIGNNTHIARNLVVYSMNHRFDGASLPYDHTMVLKPVTIGKNVWIGINVTIAPGTSIEDGAIIAMGAVVSGKVPACAVIGASRCRTLNMRNVDHYAALEAARRYGGMAGYHWSDE